MSKFEESTFSKIDPSLSTKDERWIGPWDPNYPKGGNPVPPGVHVPWGHKPEPAPEPKPVKPAEKPVEPPKALPPTDPNFEEYVLSTVEEAARNAMPKLSDVLRQAMVAEMANEVGQLGAVPTPALKDLEKSKARGAALRSLGIGLFISVLTGVGSALAAVPDGTNWFTKSGLLVTATLVVNSVVQSVLTYAHQLGWGPPQTAGAGDGK